MNRARSNLERAAVRTPNSYLEDLCFDAQQAAEKAIKAVLIHHGAAFPYVHDLDRLLQRVAGLGITVAENVRDAGALTEYAVTTRYPGLGKAVTEEQHRRALEIAKGVVEWAGAIIGY